MYEIVIYSVYPIKAGSAISVSGDVIHVFGVHDGEDYIEELEVE